MSEHAQQDHSDYSDIANHLEHVFEPPTEYDDVAFKGQMGTLEISKDRLAFTGRQQTPSSSFQTLFASILKTQHASATRSKKLKHLIKLKVKEGKDIILEFTDRVVLEIVRDDLKERLKIWKEKIKPLLEEKERQQNEASPAINQTHTKASRRLSTPYSMANVQQEGDGQPRAQQHQPDQSQHADTSASYTETDNHTETDFDDQTYDDNSTSAAVQSPKPTRRLSTPYSMANTNIREEGAAVEIAKNRAKEEKKINAARSVLKQAEEDAAKAIAERKRKERRAEEDARQRAIEQHKRKQQEEAELLRKAAEEELEAQRLLDKEAAALQQALARAAEAEEQRARQKQQQQEEEENRRRAAAAAAAEKERSKAEEAARRKAEFERQQREEQRRVAAEREDATRKRQAAAQQKAAAEAEEARRKQLAAQQKAAAAEREAAAKRRASQSSYPPPRQPRPPRGSEEEKKQVAAGKKRHAQVKTLAEKAQQKATNERLQKWKEQQAKRQQERNRQNNKRGGGGGGGAAPVVERIPKLSALLAMGGAGAEEYNQRKAAARLAKWNATGDKWQVLHQTYDGRSVSEVTKEQVIKDITADQAMDIFYSDPEKYLALHFYPQHPKDFTFVLRAESIGYEPQNVRDDQSGQFVILRHIYQRLPPLPNNVLPKPFRDQYTDHMTFGGYKLHSNRNLPIMPGRGMGMGDEANMELIDFPQPGHVRQGAIVGDCWLLSAIACVADFDWAIQRLFRKNKHKIQDYPRDPPNQYTVTLYDLTTWKEVDVVIDERLPVQADGSRHLLGARPSREGKFWVPYLEKAISIHAGGYDKICGGNCTDAWPMMTGSRNQYMIQRNPQTKKYKCCAKFNPNTQQWSPHANSPHNSNPAHWPIDWPTVGGGGERGLELTENELFQRIVVWDETNYLLGAGTAGTSDREKTDGLVDNHAYSIIDSRQNICGTGIDLLLIRNPWGEGGELENGQFMRFGPGWKRYPNIRKELNPVMEDHGLCWVTKSEFFKYFPTIYLCAFNMTRLKDPNYINDLKNDFKERPKPGAVKKATPAKAPVSNNNTQQAGGRVRIDKRPYRSSQYTLVEQSFNGGVAFTNLNKKDFHGRSIALGVNEFRANPKKYLAIHFQNNIVDEGWPPEEHHYTVIYRDGTEGLEVGAVKGGRGKRTILMNVLK